MKSKSKSKARRKPKPQIAIESESPSDFAFAVTRTAVAQICRSAGFTSAQLSALHALTSVAAAFLRAAARAATESAASANRTDSNVFDVSSALQDLRSGSLADAAAFVRSTAEIPFAKPIPQQQCGPESGPAEANCKVPRPPHVPAWLPEAPTIADRDSGRAWEGEELWENAPGPEPGPGPGGVDIAAEEREGELGVREEGERVRFKVGLKRGRRKRVIRSNHRINRGLSNN